MIKLISFGICQFVSLLLLTNGTISLLKYEINVSVFALYGRITELGLPREKYEWYFDLRRNGTVKHSGFSLRFDLMVLFITGLSNIRDVIPFPRSYGKADN